MKGMQIDTYRPTDGAHYEVAPGRGCNVFRWQVGEQEILHAPPDFPQQGRYSAGGNPVLFPAVGRTWDLAVDPPVQDRYHLAGHGDPLRMPIHGIMDECSFVRETIGEDAARIDAAYGLRVPDRVRRECYPFRMQVRLELSMGARTLGVSATVHNPGEHPAPFAFGTHPYFRISDPGRDGVSLDLPASAQVDLDPQRLIPLGTTSKMEQPFTLDAATSYDLVLTGLHERHATLTDRRAGYRVRITYDSAVEFLVIYSPAGSPFICVEPWTAGLGGFATLADPGWRERPAMPMLPPGQTRTVAVRYDVETL